MITRWTEVTNRAKSLKCVLLAKRVLASLQRWLGCFVAAVPATSTAHAAGMAGIDTLDHPQRARRCFDGADHTCGSGDADCLRESGPLAGIQRLSEICHGCPQDAPAARGESCVLNPCGQLISSLIAFDPLEAQQTRPTGQLPDWR